MNSEIAKDIEGQTITTRLDSGRCICIRTISQNDRKRLRTGIEALSPRSRYLRFFSAAPTPPKVVIDRLLDIDHEEHLAWGAIDLDDADRPAIGAVHAIQTEPDGAHEFSIAVLDQYHGEGVGTLLTAVILVHCQALGIEKLQAQTLAENGSAIGLLASLNAEVTDTHMAVAEYDLDVDLALESLLKSNENKALTQVIDDLREYA